MINPFDFFFLINFDNNLFPRNSQGTRFTLRNVLGSDQKGTIFHYHVSHVSLLVPTSNASEPPTQRTGLHPLHQAPK